MAKVGFGMEVRHTNFLISEVGRVLVLLAIIAGFLVLGTRAETVGVLAKIWVEKPFGLEVFQTDFEWSPTPTTEPWRLSESDLDYQRVIYNWMNKPGLRWLAFQLVASILGVGLILANVKLVVRASFGRVRAKKKKVVQAPSISGEGVSGSVTIQTSAGIIYMSNLTSSIKDTLEEYATILSGARLWVVVS